jgi:hypothetical protein
VSEQLLTILKLCLLVLLYLFFLRVLRAVWAEVKAPRPAVVAGGAPAGGARVQAARAKEKKPKRSRGQPSKLTIVNPPEQRGRSFPLGQELSVGRAAGCVITLDDTFVSQLHARVFQQDGQTFVEDLGSTNGTYLNGQKVSGPMPMGRGDQLRVGDTVMELA